MALGNFHTEKKGWYQNSQIRPFYDLYVGLLENTPLPESLIPTECPQCQIKFITSSSNSGRKDVHCPFGCRAKRKKLKSNERSKAYYQTTEGKQKKKAQNDKRKKLKTKNASAKKSDNLTSTYLPPLQYIKTLLMVLIGQVVNNNTLESLIFRAIDDLRQHPLEILSKQIMLTGYD